MDEMRPTLAVYCKGTCGNLLKSAPFSPEPDDGLKSEYRDGYCKECHPEMIVFYLIWHGKERGEGKSCPIKFKANSEESAKTEAKNLIIEEESRNLPHLVTEKFRLYRKNPDESKKLIAQYDPPFVF